MYYSGIDQHKRYSVIATYDADGQLVKHARVPNDRPRLLAYFTALEGPHHAVVEATGNWYWLADTLANTGVDLCLGHAKRLKAISAAKVKTDTIDAKTLAQLLRADLIPRAHMIAPERRAPRDLMRARLRLVAKVISCENSQHRLLEKFNVTRVSDLDELYQLQVACHQAQIDLLQQQITTLEAALHPTLVPHPDVQRLLWIPGIGKINALTIYTEIDGIARFPSVKQFLSYCRLVPGANNSGGRTRHRSGNKEGNRYLKIAFSHAAVRAVQYNPEIRAFYRTLQQRKPDRVARARVAIEVARIVYHVLRRGEPFNGRFKHQPLQRTKQLQWPRLASPAA